MRENTLVWITGGSIIIGMFFLLNSMVSTYEIFVYPEQVAAATSTVTVSASVQAVISCSTDTGSTDFGTWTDDSIKTSSPNASTTMSCANSSGGCTLYVKDDGSGSNPGLWNSTASHLIASADATLSASTEGYGIQATSTTAGSGATLSVDAKYDKSGNNVGGLLRTNTTVASTGATSSDREAVVTHKAAVSNSTPSGSYTDTITYECTGN